MIVRSPLGRALVWIAIPAGILTAIFHVREIGFLGVFAAYTTLLAVGVIMLRSPSLDLPTTDVIEEIDDEEKSIGEKYPSSVGITIEDEMNSPVNIHRWG